MKPVRRMLHAVRSTVRYKLLVLTLVPILVVLPIALGAAALVGLRFTYEQLYIKVNTDLAVAHDLFERIKSDYRNRLERLAESYAFRTAVIAGDAQSVDQQLHAQRREGGFSFLRVVPAETVYQAGMQPAPGAGVVIMSYQELADISLSLANSVRLRLINTPRARPSERTEEDRAMMIRAVHPVIGAGGRIDAYLEGGVLLNNNFDFVDAIRDLVYGPGSLHEDSIGTVTVFLDDVRISTNVPRAPGERALGTRVSDEVRTRVLDQGGRWIDRAFVVNDWYISAYEPITDTDGRRVGILYAGYLEAPYRSAFWKAVGLMVLLIVALVALYSEIAIKGAKSVFRPLEKMARVVREARAGKPGRIGQVDSRDEIAGLAREFDAMLDLLELRAGEVQRAADNLEEKVADRTRELQTRNEELQRTIKVLRDTRRKLVLAEKLAALGELTAGVAHEINNPTQVILGNMDVLSQELGDQLEPVREEADLIVAQVYRIREIVDNLLKYARPAEYAGHLGEIDVNQVVRDTMPLVQHLHKKYEFDLHLALDAVRPVRMNTQELQQVLVNLVSNAIHALPERHGQVWITTRDWSDRGVIIEVTDNGRGMDPDQASHVFNPFYSTKREGEGTGLGLSVSYGLVRRYGGEITVDTAPGEGSVFGIRLLSEPILVEDAETLAEQLHAIEVMDQENNDEPQPRIKTA